VFRCALLDPTRGRIALCGMWPSCPARINRREPAGGPSGRWTTSAASQQASGRVERIARPADRKLRWPGL